MPYNERKIKSDGIGHGGLKTSIMYINVRQVYIEVRQSTKVYNGGIQ